ncbi:hypothetical protein BOX15_Mlig032608g1, partial [Macrostomum lignano]
SGRRQKLLAGARISLCSGADAVYEIRSSSSEDENNQSTSNVSKNPRKKKPAVAVNKIEYHETVCPVCNCPVPKQASMQEHVNSCLDKD